MKLQSFKIEPLQFRDEKGYSIENPRAYVGYDLDPIVDKINNIIKIINKIKYEKP